ncbi:MAG TPA: PIG-L deacetylase family protein [Candidatus Binatus sp.]|nr:PIG-L deacetylase family protein [Candidatus Binatus sp.]
MEFEFMQKLSLPQKKDGPLKALFLGAHSDDIELGCGGTVLSFLEQGQQLDATWVVFAANPKRRTEAEESAHMFLAEAVRKEIIVKDFKESFFPYIGVEIKGFFEDLKHAVSPDVVFTHFSHDLHQDHRLISELTWNTFRDHLILEYEIVKYDGGLGSPNVFVHLTEEVCSRKVKYLLENFSSQRSHQWFTEETFRAILRLRGVEANAPSKNAEAFYSRKIVLG